MHPPGRPGILEDEMETLIVQTLGDEYEANSAFTRGKLMSYVTSTFAQPVTRGWLGGSLNRHGDAIKVCTSYPQEDARFLIPREYLEQHIVNMQTYVTGRTAELVFNLDEVGSSDWEDRKVKKVIVPAAVDSDAVFHPVSRRFRHMTLLVCVSAGGDSLCPMLVLGQAIPDDIWAKGLRPDEDVMIRRRETPYMNEELSYDYLSEVFIPYVCAVREKMERNGEQAVLLMDGMKAHCSDRALRYLGENNVAAILFPSHTTNLFQALDLSLFGALKRRKGRTDGDFNDRSLKDQITKLLRAYEEASTSFTIRGSFRRAGFHYVVTTRPYALEFSEEKVRENPGFCEIWQKNYSVEVLQRRRRIHQFGLINSEYLMS
jgi:hypothetical protein